MLAAVKSDGSALEYAPPELRADREVVLAAVKSHGQALVCASPELQAELTSSLDEKRGTLIALVQKVSAELLHQRFEPLDSSYCKLLEHVRTSWNKTGETRYFDLYE